MKFKKGIAIGAIAALLIGSTFVYSAAGDNDDPLVSLSYLEERLAKVTGAAKSDALEVIELMNGETLVGNEGTEITLRGGRATAYGVGKFAGLADITEGRDIETSESLKYNHLLIVPRSDGRGIRATTNNTWVMVRGEYKIIK